MVNMKFEDMANWTEEQLKNEVVRLSETINQKLLENDNWKIPIDGIENVDTGHPSIEWYEQRHQDDCIRINELTVTVDTLVDRYANLRKNKGMC